MKKLTITVIILAQILTLTAQNHEAGGWAFLNIKKKVGEGFSLALRGEYRCRDNFKRSDEYLVRLMGEYKACDYLDVGVGYDFCNKLKVAEVKDGLSIDKWTQKNHRGLVEAKGHYSLYRWTFQLRERYVYAYAMDADVAARDDMGMYVTCKKDGGWSHVLRHKPGVSYSLWKGIFKPFVEVELYNRIDKGFDLQQVHLHVGTTIRFDAVNSLKVYYVMQDKISEKRFVHTVALEYSISL